MENLLFGVEALDELLPNSLYPGSLIVIAGHPGAGKTTLASTICYTNALMNHKCLYVSFQESREKLLKVMKNLGMDFSILEHKGLYRYLRIPISKDVETAINIINDTISRWSPKIIVIDSMNALMQAVESSDKRAWLQNYFSSIPEIAKGIAILIAEIPLKEEVVDLGSIEFVADILLILKHRVSSGLLTRILEIRKSRGSPITIAELPFTISPGKGIEIFVPPLLSEVSRAGPEIKSPCTILDNILGHIHKGHSIYVEYPPDFRALEATPLILGIAFRNNLKAFLLSYLYSQDTMYDLLLRAYSKWCSGDKIEKVIKKYVTLFSLNPFRYSLAENVAEELRVIKNSNADVVVFHGIEIPSIVNKSRLDQYIPMVYNQVNRLKQEHKVVARVGSKIDNELSAIFSNLADVVIKFIPSSDSQSHNIYVWRRGTKPVILSPNDVDKCMEEIVSNICRDEDTSV